MTAATAHAEPNTEQITLPVEGMTCAACQANVQRALNATPGVGRAAVNLMTHEATVAFNPAVASPQTLVDAVNATGYVSRLRVPAADPIAEDEAKNKRTPPARDRCARPW